MLHHRNLLVGLLLLAFLLRVWGLDFGLPYDFHEDENYYLDPVLAWHIDGKAEAGLDPSLFERLPHKYTLLAGYWLWFKLSPYEASEQWATATWFFARFWSVVFGVLMVALAYPAGKRLYGKRGGALAAAILAGLFLPARESHFAVNDTAVTFFVLLGVYFSVSLFWRRRWPDFVLAGVVVAFAAATKLTGWFTFVALAAAYLLTFVSWGQPVGLTETKLAGRRKELKYLGLSFLGVAGVIALIAVRSLTELPGFVNGLVQLFRAVPYFYTNSFKGIQMAPVSGWHFYLNVLGWGVGWLLVGVIVWAMASVCWRRYRPGLAVVIFSAVFFWYIGGREFLFARFILPIVPPLVLLAAGELSRLKPSRLAGRYQAIFWPALASLLLAQPLLTSIWFDYLLTRPDTRLEASEWLIEEFSADTVIVKEAYSVFPATVLLNKRWPSREIQLNERGSNRNDPDYFVAHKTDLIVTSNYISGRARHNPAEESARLAQQALLAQKAELIKTFNPYRGQEDPNRWFYLDELYGPAGETLFRRQPGPLLKIYRLPYQNQPYSLEMPPVSAPVQVNFADKMLLLGYDLPVRRANPGEAIPLTLYWQALAKMDKNYVIFDHLLDSQQRNWGGYDRWPQETAKTTLWQPGEIVVDTFNIPVAANAPAGIYSIDIGLYAQDDSQGTSLPVFQNGAPIDQNSIRLGPVKVGASALGGTTIRPDPQTATAANFDNQIELLGFDLANPAPNAQNLTLTLYWESLAQTPVDWSIFVHLRDAAGQTVAQKDGPAGGGQYPTSLWDAGETISDNLTVPLPDNLPPGAYQLVVGLYNLTDGARLALPGHPDNALLLDTIELK